MEGENELRELIDAFYKAGGRWGWNGKVNDSVAEVFMVMLREAKKCSSALNWIPVPPLGRVDIKWVVRQLGQSLLKSFLNHEVKLVCAREVIRKWERELMWASENNCVGIGVIACD